MQVSSVKEKKKKNLFASLSVTRDFVHDFIVFPPPFLPTSNRKFSDDVNRYTFSRIPLLRRCRFEKTPVANGVSWLRTKGHVQSAEIPGTIRSVYVQHRRLQDAESHGGQERVAA